MENFLKDMNATERLNLDHGFVGSLLDLFFKDFPEYQSFKYWIYQSIPISKRKDSEDPIPFYKNYIKLHLFKEILNDIKMSRQNQDPLKIKIGILKVVIEIMCLRDVVHTKIQELVDLFNKYQPNSFIAVKEMITRNEYFTFDMKSFRAIYKHFTDLISNFEKFGYGKKDSNNQYRPRSKSMTKIARVYDFLL